MGTRNIAMLRTLRIHTHGKGLHEITGQVVAVIDEAHEHTPIDEGLCTLFVRHTSASLIIQENADPTARQDLEVWLDRLVPPTGAAGGAAAPAGGFVHDDEGPDDMPAHIKTALTAVSIGIPIARGKLTLGTWQGIYLWEHRATPHTREVVVYVGA